MASIREAAAEFNIFIPANYAKQNIRFAVGEYCRSFFERHELEAGSWILFDGKEASIVEFDFRDSKLEIKFKSNGRKRRVEMHELVIAFRNKGLR